MPSARWMLCAWPGLPQLWRGEWWGVALASGFTLLLNATLMVTFVWTDLVGPDIRTVAWGVIAFTWLTSAVASRWQAGRAAEGEFPSVGDLFPQALGEYLRGNWVAAEELVARLLRRNARDVDARLLLATMMRHTGRLPEARRELDEIERYAGAAKWRSEVRRERELLDAAAEEERTAAGTALADAGRQAEGPEGLSQAA